MPINIPINELVPHSGRMCLLDRVLDYSEDSLTAEVTLHSNSTFVRNGNVGAWIAIEYMAQAISAWAGVSSVENGDKPKLGFLLGSRHFSSTSQYLPFNTPLEIRVNREFQGENGLASFSAWLKGEGVEIQATLSVFQPNDPDVLLRES